MADGMNAEREPRIEQLNMRMRRKLDAGSTQRDQDLPVHQGRSADFGHRSPSSDYRNALAHALKSAAPKGDEEEAMP